MSGIVSEQDAPSTGLRPVPLPRFGGEEPASRSVGPGHRYGPEVVEAVQALVEGTDLPQHVIAARVGVCRATVSNLRVRHGWTRPGPARLRGQRGGDNPVLAAAIAAARPLIEDTTLSLTAIAKRLGVGRSSLMRWRVRFGWRRPKGAPTFLPPPRADGRVRPVRYRSVPGRPYAADAVERARALLTGTLLSQKAIARQIGVSQWWVGQLLRRKGWERPPVPPRSKRFAASRRTGTLTDGDRRGRPYAREVRRDARNLWEHTLLSTRMIGLRVGCSLNTVARWAREEAWERPRGRSSARKLRGYFGRMRGG